MIPPQILTLLVPLARRRSILRRSLALTRCWLPATVAGVVVLLLERRTGTVIPGARAIVVLAGLLPAYAIWRSTGRRPPDWHGLARQVEARRPALNGRLLTALEQEPGDTGHLSYLQLRVVRECVADDRLVSWRRLFPRLPGVGARLANLVVLAAFLAVLAGLGWPAGQGPLSAPPIAREITVTPGDTALERGETLVVMARFAGDGPAQADLVVRRDGEVEERVPLVRSLADPMFGATIQGLDRDLTYRVVYDGERTRDYSVAVFEVPRLARADATVTYPEYTGLAPKHIEDTRRVSAVEGSRLDLALRLNKSVAEARLLPESGGGKPIVLDLEAEGAAATLSTYALANDQTFRLALTDEQGRTNRSPARFVFRVYPNRSPELKVAKPRGDSRPSPLEEMVFEGTVSDDFGLLAFGLAYSLAGDPPTEIPIGAEVPAQDPRTYRHTLALEELGVGADDLVSWYVWADDVGPDGKPRRTMGDLYFAEVRAFDEVFREAGGGQGGEQGGQDGEEQGGGGGGQLGELSDQLKDLINATWRMQRTARMNPDPPAETPPPEPEPSLDQAGVRGGGPIVSAQPGPSLRIAPPVLFGLPLVLAQADREGRSSPGVDRPSFEEESPSDPGPSSDQEVLRLAQRQILELAVEARENQQDPLAAEQWDRVVDLLQEALDLLLDAEGSVEEFQAANAAQKAAFQALLRLQEREYAVSRRNQQQSQANSSRRQQMQNQLEQLELTQSENRYETERQASAPQTEQRREQLQILSRIKELAQRQQDLNERFQELQTALREARTDEERDEVRRELKRLQEEERRMLDDVDELQQRMDQPANQTAMSEQRQQLEQARQDMQQAAEAAARGEASQALASGSRAERNMEEMGEELRRANANEFEDDMRRLRSESREAVRRQETIRDQLAEPASRPGNRLADEPAMADAQARLAEQAERLEGLLDEVTEMSRLAEDAEPLMSQELYDSLRTFTQEDRDDARQVERELIEGGMMTHDLYRELQAQGQESQVRLVEATSALLSEGYLPEARRVEERAREGIESLRDGIERAAERVLGDEAEALRLAGDQLDRVSEALTREIENAQAETEPGTEPGAGSPTSPPAEPNGEGQPGGSQPNAGNEAGGGGEPSNTAPRNPLNLEQLVETGGLDDGGPITGGGFGGWSDRLREVEELVGDPTLSAELSRARERARLFRQAYRRDGERPDWAEVRLEVLGPLVEVREDIDEELARRDPGEKLVPIDRDAVPARYQDLVRRYYEALGVEE